MLTGVVLVGIAAGALVFIGSLLAVFVLLHKGGSFDRMALEAVGMPIALGEQKPLLYDDLLDKANMLELLPPPLGTKQLKGKRVFVKDFVGLDDVADLFAISCGKPQAGIYRDLKFDADEMIWRYLPHGPFASEDEFKKFYLSKKIDARHFVLMECENNQPIGMVTLGKHSPRNLRVEIMNLWLTPAFQGSAALTEAVLLLLTYLFDNGYRRIEWRCDGHNVRARRAAHSLGFTFEGVMRKHRIVKNCNCDTVVFAAINSEREIIVEHLQQKLQQILHKVSPVADLAT
ncbi:ribosomal protein n-acetylase [Plasmopara halstedii]|uniref:Ribosomal protein n-acetylase n=1 Tax=Plasmopara halstedii TaxID=4781 RepID=A0A0P1B7S4_PLAHL|nr:ribosomal protein n-acetylase [Plasmopara halstedii]CEG50473.1 ribosomal protein n-acetylase [Plasmopara halstedii]|eukprot:XP_024586842.1 ribosomal protein n-acetylase [Plasmopara halstedii]